jgi:hypothetical protein
MNRILMEKTRSMFNGVGLAQELWIEAVDTVSYLVNQSPTSMSIDKTLHVACTSKKPSLEHLKVSYCDTYVHVPKEKRSKLDNGANKCIYIGYKDSVKGYKPWNLETRKIVYSRDIIFKEIKGAPKQEEPREEEPKRMQFEL